MVLCTGSRGLCLVSFLGFTLAVASAGLAGAIIFKAQTAEDWAAPEGWASPIVVTLLLCSGVTLFSVGLIQSIREKGTDRVRFCVALSISTRRTWVRAVFRPS